MVRCRMRSLGCSPCTGAIVGRRHRGEDHRRAGRHEALRTAAAHHRPRPGRLDGAEEARRLLLMSGLLRICTAGSVDDGKSTLIGRLLYDSRVVYEDQVSVGREGLEEPRRRPDRLLAVHRRPEGRARTGHHDRRRLPLLRDRAAQVHPGRHAGPRAVHAQHGHGRVDGRRRGPARRRPQRRPHAVAAARARSRGCSASTTSSSPSTRWTWSDFDRDVFDSICDDFEELLRGANSHAIPHQRAARRQRHHAERSHAVVRRTRACSSILETVEGRSQRHRPSRSASRCRSCSARTMIFGGMPGRLRPAPSGVGDAVTVLPSGRTSECHRIVTWDGDLEMAHAPMSVTLTLEDEIDISRGDMLRRLRATAQRQQPSLSKAVRGRDGVDGRAAARSGARLPAEAGHARRSARRSIAAWC